MKYISFIVPFACFFITFYSEGQVKMDQVGSVEIGDLFSLQTLNTEQNYNSSITQFGNNNSAILSQIEEGELNSFPNSSNSYQQGNNNLVEITQNGNGNVSFVFQMGLLGNEATNGNISYSLLDVVPQNMVSIITNPSNNVITAGAKINDIEYEVLGDGNKMTITQNGNNNGIMAIQQGSYNTLSAEQLGNNNYLLAWQKGSNNTIDDYKQGNKSDPVLYDKIIQTGYYLTLKSDMESNSSVNGNTFIQTGTNLSLEMNSDLINSPGGVQVTQTGNDMKVVIDQSYFSFPLK